MDFNFNDNTINLALNDFQDKVLSMGGRELSEYGLPQPQLWTMMGLQENIGGNRLQPR